jgi:hypothetical protein
MIGGFIVTPYSNIYKRFERKIKKDISYFCYDGTTEDEQIKIINKRNSDLLDDAVNELQPKVSIQQKVDFINKDDTLEQFDFDLITTEEDLISDLMIIKLFEEESIKLKELQKYLGNDIKTFSPAEERKTFMDMLEIKQNRFEVKLGNYNSINRETGKYLMPY